MSGPEWSNRLEFRPEGNDSLWSRSQVDGKPRVQTGEELGPDQICLRDEGQGQIGETGQVPGSRELKN